MSTPGRLLSSGPGRLTVRPFGPYPGRYNGNNRNTTAPTVVSANVDVTGTILTIVWSEPVTADVSFGPQIHINGGSGIDTSYISGSGSTTTRFDGFQAYAAQVVTLDIFASLFQDMAGNFNGAVTGAAVTNNSAVPIPPNQIAGFDSAVLVEQSRANSLLWQDAGKTTLATADGDKVYIAKCPYSGIEYSAGADAGRPTLRRSGAFAWLEYDGVANILTAARTFTQPYAKGACFTATIDSGTAFDGGSTNEGFAARSGVIDPANVAIYAGTGLGSSNMVITANPNSVVALFNGASSVVNLSGTETTGAAGAQNATGSTVGCRSGLPSLNVQKLYGYASYTGTMSAANRAALSTFLRSLAP